jgi:hypothetical protein
LLICGQQGLLLDIDYLLSTYVTTCLLLLLPDSKRQRNGTSWGRTPPSRQRQSLQVLPGFPSGRCLLALFASGLGSSVGAPSTADPLIR